MLHEITGTTEHGQSLWWVGVMVFALSTVVGLVHFWKAESRYFDLYKRVHGVAIDRWKVWDYGDLVDFGRRSGKALSQKQDDPDLENARRQYRLAIGVFFATMFGGLAVTLALTMVYV